MENPERVTYFAATQTRGKRIPFGIKAKDRARHLYVVGKTGVGKTTLLENLAIQDIRNGEGLAFIDPQGMTCEKLLHYIPQERIRDVVYVETTVPLDFRRIIDEGKILLVRLPKGHVSEEELRALGNSYVTHLFTAAAGRADAGAERLSRLPSFNLYIDEFPSIAGPSLTQALTEARKYKLNLVLSHQYLAQLDASLKAAIFGNVGTLISFRVGPEDASELERVFAPEYTREDLMNLGRAHIVLSLMIDHVGARPFRAATIPPIEPPKVSYAQEARAAFSPPPELTGAVEEVAVQAEAERKEKTQTQTEELKGAIDEAVAPKPFEISEDALRAVFKEDV